MAITPGVVRMSVDAVEGSTYVLAVDFRDADGSEVTPNTANWTLYGHDHQTIINGREGVPLTGEYIVLTGDDLALPNSAQRWRYVLVKATYNSATFGNDLEFRSEIRFRIANLFTIDPGR